MDTLDKLVALIREFAEKASVPATEAVQAVVRAVGWECLGAAISQGVFSILAIGIALISGHYLVMALKSDSDPWADAYGPASLGGVVFGGIGGLMISISFISGLGAKFACIAEPLGYTLKRMVLK